MVAAIPSKQPLICLEFRTHLPVLKNSHLKLFRTSVPLGARLPGLCLRPCQPFQVLARRPDSQEFSQPAVCRSRMCRVHQAATVSGQYIPHEVSTVRSGNARSAPSLYQLYSLSTLSGYRLIDWLDLFRDLAGQRVALSDALPIVVLDWVELDARILSLRTPRSPVFMTSRKRTFRRHSLHSASGLPLGSSLRQMDSVSRHGRKKTFRYLKIGSHDALAFPDLLPGSIVRVRTTISSTLKPTLRLGKTPGRTMFFWSATARDITCSRVPFERNPTKSSCVPDSFPMHRSNSLWMPRASYWERSTWRFARSPFSGGPSSPRQQNRAIPDARAPLAANAYEHAMPVILFSVLARHAGFPSGKPPSAPALSLANWEIVVTTARQALFLTTRLGGLLHGIFIS